MGNIRNIKTEFIKIYTSWNVNSHKLYMLLGHLGLLVNHSCVSFLKCRCIHLRKIENFSHLVSRPISRSRSTKQACKHDIRLQKKLAGLLGGQTIRKRFRHSHATSVTNKIAVHHLCRAMPCENYVKHLQFTSAFSSKRFEWTSEQLSEQRLTSCLT